MTLTPLETTFLDSVRAVLRAQDKDLTGLQRHYRAVLAKYHPDRNPGDAAAEERSKRANALFGATNNFVRTDSEEAGHALRQALTPYRTKTPSKAPTTKGGASNSRPQAGSVPPRRRPAQPRSPRATRAHRSAYTRNPPRPSSGRPAGVFETIARAAACVAASVLLIVAWQIGTSEHDARIELQSLRASILTLRAQNLHLQHNCTSPASNYGTARR